jgi:hypothetical protein
MSRDNALSVTVGNSATVPKSWPIVLRRGVEAMLAVDVFSWWWTDEYFDIRHVGDIGRTTTGITKETGKAQFLEDWHRLQ